MNTTAVGISIRPKGASRTPAQAIKMRVRAEPKNNFDDFSFVCKCVQLPGGASGTVHWESSDTGKTIYWPERALHPGTGMNSQLILISMLQFEVRMARESP